MVSREYITGAQAHQPLRVNKTVFRFSKDRLPPALSFYEAELGKLTRPNHKGWCACRCPFHQSKSGKSFAVHIEGGFVCHSCGVKGGDIVSFLRLRDGLSFKEACQQLRVWDEVGQPAPPTVVVRYLTFDYDIDGLHYSASVRDEPRNYASVVRRFYRESGEQLTSLGMGQSESAEGESRWARLGLATAELRDLEIVL